MGKLLEESVSFAVQDPVSLSYRSLAEFLDKMALAAASSR